MLKCCFARLWQSGDTCEFRDGFILVFRVRKVTVRANNRNNQVKQKVRIRGDDFCFSVCLCLDLAWFVLLFDS